jgi:hypothetical protein
MDDLNKVTVPPYVISSSVELFLSPQPVLPFSELSIISGDSLVDGVPRLGPRIGCDERQAPSERSHFRLLHIIVRGIN